jgi:hypothetical protein
MHSLFQSFIFHRCISQLIQNHMLITKKPGAVPTEPTFARTGFSNLPLASTLLERERDELLAISSPTNDLLPYRESAYRSGFSTETAIMRVLSDILEAVDHVGDVAILAHFDLSAAFGTCSRSQHFTLVEYTIYSTKILLNAPTVWKVWYYIGSNHTSAVEGNLSVTIPRHPCSFLRV